MLSEDDHRPKIKKKKMRNDKKHNKSIKEKQHEVLPHGASSLTVEKKNDYQEESSELDTVAALDAYAANNDIQKHGADNNGGGISSWDEAFAIASKIQPDDSMLLDDVNNVAPSTTTANDTTGVVQISRLINSHNNKAMHNNSHSSTPPPPPFIANEDAPTMSPRKHKRKRSHESNTNNDNDPDCNDSEDSSSLEGRMIHVPSDSNCDSRSTTSSSSSSVLVLVHNKSGLVYSTGVRNEDGTRLIIGKIGVVDLKKGGDINNNSNIIFDSHALKEMKRRQVEEEEEEVVNDDEEINIDTSTTVTPSTAAALAIFPYPTNPDDHCETPLKSYEDILPLLHAAARSFSSSSSSTLKIYDPYYCDGSVIKHLSTLGYSNVYNKKEDCYKIWQMKSSEPIYDILITNPPYSEDHIERLITYVTSQTKLGTTKATKAWLLLMPTWVHKKEYYITATTASKITPFYIVPKKRYIYCPPPNYRTKRESGVHKKSSPFISMWYCWGGTSKRNEEWMDAFFRSSNNNNSGTTCDLARSRSALRDLRRSGGGGGKK
jgi:hypothetical protein